MSNPHTRSSVLEFSSGGILKSETPVVPDGTPVEFLTIFARVLWKHPAPEGWAKVGFTGYLDQQIEADFPAGKSVLAGYDAASRPYISFKYKAGNKSRVATVFQRYTEGGPPVMGGSTPELDGCIGRDGGSLFASAVGPEGLALLGRLFSGQKVEADGYDWSSQTLVRVFVELS